MFCGALTIGDTCPFLTIAFKSRWCLFIPVLVGCAREKLLVTAGFIRINFQRIGHRFSAAASIVPFYTVQLATEYTV